MLIAGIDEAARAAGGPVVAAASFSTQKRRVRGLRDSKVMTPEQREEVAIDIRSRAIAWAVAASDVGEIDAMNILRATLLAMRRAVEALAIQPIEALVDGDHCPQLVCPVYAIVKGDRDVPAISARRSSKTTRDAMLIARPRARCMASRLQRIWNAGAPLHSICTARVHITGNRSHRCCRHRSRSGRAHSSTRPRVALTRPRATFASMRRRCELRVGFVGVRGARVAVASSINCRSRATASSRLSPWRCCCAWWR
jgi:ribonuclease HII